MTRTRLIFDCPIPLWAGVAFGLVVLCVAVVMTWRDSGRLRWRARWAILILQALGLAMLTGLMLNPKIVRLQRDPQKPVCTVLVDGSRSMQREDRYAGDEAAWIQSRRTASSQSVARESLADAVLASGDAGLITHLRDMFDTTLLQFARVTKGFSIE